MYYTQHTVFFFFDYINASQLLLLPLIVTPSALCFQRSISSPITVTISYSLKPYRL